MVISKLKLFYQWNWKAAIQKFQPRFAVKLLIISQIHLFNLGWFLFSQSEAYRRFTAHPLNGAWLIYWLPGLISCFPGLFLRYLGAAHFSKISFSHCRSSLVSNRGPFFYLILLDFRLVSLGSDVCSFFHLVLKTWQPICVSIKPDFVYVSATLIQNRSAFEFSKFWNQILRRFVYNTQ